jgi:hypothetical protein
VEISGKQRTRDDAVVFERQFHGFSPLEIGMGGFFS